MLTQNKYLKTGKLLMIAIALFLTVFSSSPAMAEMRALFQYNLSDFTGSIPYNWAALSVDRGRDEIYVIYKNDIEIFNEKGMKVYSFGDDIQIKGVIRDVAVESNGNVFMLTSDGDTYSVIRCNYRGEPVSEIKLNNLPSEFSNFMPSRLIYRKDLLYLADLFGDKMFVITNTDGVFREGYLINTLLNLDELEGKAGQEKDIVGFSVDSEGNMIFTIPTLFKAFRLSPDRSVQSFGQPGSIPGKFGVIAGIESDESGNYYVVDTLKSVVMVFDRQFEFITEFGYRGNMPGNLIAPKQILVNGEYVYISQANRRGVSVYRIINN